MCLVLSTGICILPNNWNIVLIKPAIWTLPKTQRALIFGLSSGWILWVITLALIIKAVLEIMPQKTVCVMLWNPTSVLPVTHSPKYNHCFTRYNVAWYNLQEDWDKIILPSEGFCRLWVLSFFPTGYASLLPSKKNSHRDKILPSCCLST